MAGHRYEVLLRREGGMNRTVIIEDCLSEREAKEVAEAMYGMEALRATWRPVYKELDCTKSGGSSSSSWSGSSSSSSGGDIDGETMLYGLIGIGILIAIWIVISCWPFFLFGALCWAGWKWWKQRKDSPEK